MPVQYVGRGLGKIFKYAPNMKKKWILAENQRPRMVDGVEVTKEDNRFTVYRYIEDWDEDGDTIYSVDEYLSNIPETALKPAIKADSDGEVIQWFKSHLIESQSNSLDAIEAFLKEHNVPFRYDGSY